MSKIAILADSGCQLESREGLYIAPLQVTIADKGYKDCVEIDSFKVFSMMKEDASCMPKTSLPLGEDITSAIMQIKADGYDEIIAITIATGLSSTLNAVNLSCEIEEIPVILIDSKGTAGIHAYLVETCEAMIKDGYSALDIKHKLDEMVKDSGTIIMAPNLDHLKRGGRITPAVAMLGGLLKIVPVMKLNPELGGRIDQLGKVRTTKKALQMMVDDMISCGVNSKDYKITIEHVLAEDTARELEALMRERIGDIELVFGLLPSVVGVHMGIGGVGCQYIRKA